VYSWLLDITQERRAMNGESAEDTAARYAAETIEHLTREIARLKAQVAARGREIEELKARLDE
jgi:predicted RNase H-like nuclease (RuvC/YqgF family)